VRVFGVQKLRACSSSFVRKSGSLTAVAMSAPIFSTISQGLGGTTIEDHDGRHIWRSPAQRSRNIGNCLIRFSVRTANGTQLAGTDLRQHSVDAP